jgi:subtilisin family serine protease
MNRQAAWLAISLFVLFASPLHAIDGSVPAIGGDVSKLLLGDGTGVVVAIVDSGVDDAHPALTGLDSLGQPRMVAEANFVTSEPGNTGNDVHGHGTWVASAALSRDPVFGGMAPDARFINARVLDSGNGFPSDVQVRNGIGFAIGQGADILNASLNFFGANSSGNSQLDLMLDWAAYDRGVHVAVCCGNISQGVGTTQVRGPGSSYNGLTVGRTTANFSRIHADSATAFTSDGRMKPDIVAPGTGLALANDDWEGAAADWDFGLGGCSFATPHVAGLIAQQLEAGATHGLSTSPLVIKATVMNSADKILDQAGNSWTPNNWQTVAGVSNTTQPLDSESGAGQIDGFALAQQYLAGEKSPGLVDPVGWDLHSIGNGGSVDYELSQSLLPGTTLNATLTWFRQVSRSDNGNGVIDALDTFSVLQPLSNLNLEILQDGMPLAASMSGRDNVEHLSVQVEPQSYYTLRVHGISVRSGLENFALAWSAAAVPEPGSWGLVAGACSVLLLVVRAARKTADKYAS